MDHENEQSPVHSYDPDTGVDPDNPGVADGDAVPATGHRGSSDADEGSPHGDNEERSAD